MTEIKCSVDTCHYYAEGDRCTAPAIEVDHSRSEARGPARTTETVGRGRPGGRMEVGEIGERRTQARVSEDTCCRTFVLSRRTAT